MVLAGDFFGFRGDLKSHCLMKGVLGEACIRQAAPLWPRAAWEREYRELAWPGTLTQMTLTDLAEHLSPSSLYQTVELQWDPVLPERVWEVSNGEVKGDTYSRTSCLQPISCTCSGVQKSGTTLKNCDFLEIQKWMYMGWIFTIMLSVKQMGNCQKQRKLEIQLRMKINLMLKFHLW